MKVDRRRLLIGGGVGVGLVVALAAWPRHVGSGLRAGDKEAVLGPFIKVHENGRVTVAVPQAEAGQGSWTGLAQIVADELGAKWEAMAVEPAPSSPLYANPLIDIAGLRPWNVRAVRGKLRVTAGSTSIRAFEAPLRQAAAAARGLLVAAAAKRWDVAAAECDTIDGTVVHEGKRIGFGLLAADAADRDPPPLALRAAGSGKIAGRDLARLDLPPKSDGSMRFAGDVRLPDMVFASLRMAPPGGTLDRYDGPAARRVAGVGELVVGEGWLAAIGPTWAVAEKALAAANPRWTAPAGVDSAAVARALRDSLADGLPETVFSRGSVAPPAPGTVPVTAEYHVAPAQHLDLEPLCATARFSGDRLELWVPSLAPEFARAMAADAANVAVRSVTFYPTAVGGGSGRALEAAAVPIAVALARKAGRPVQLTIPHAVSANHDPMRSPLLARLSAVPDAASGTIASWTATVATAPGLEGALARLAGVDPPAADVAASVPPYGIPAIRLDRASPPLPIATGYLRGGHDGVAGFVTESFVDEVARAMGAEPLAFRVAMLGGNVRLAKAIMTAAAIGQWDGGGAGSSMGLACATAFGSHIGLLAQARIGEGQRIVVDRLVAAVDVGRAINPGLVRQQVEGGLLAALALATMSAPVIVAGMPRARPLRALGLERLAGTPRIEVEIIPSNEAPGGVSGLASTVLAAAVGNALAAGGRRLRSLPFDPSGGDGAAPDHPAIPSPRIGVLLINLGTPDAPDASSVRRYLAEFLSDRRVIEIPPLAWQPILHGIILRTRPRKSAHAYAQVWGEDGSPLAAITRRQARALQQRLGDGALVEHAMRYGKPGIAAALDGLIARGCTRILAAPLYPQYSGATTASANDAIFAGIAARRWQPALRTLPPYYDDPLYLEALALDLGRQLAALDFRPQRLLLSFHGMPQRTLKLGDPYHCHCQKTARLLAERLDIPTEISFQSRFGRAKWLEPATDAMLGALGGRGVERLAIAAPGFSADCLETIEEIGIRGREQFLAGGGTHFARLDCLNDGAEGMAMIEALVRRELAGWLDGN